MNARLRWTLALVLGLMLGCSPKAEETKKTSDKPAAPPAKGDNNTSANKPATGGAATPPAKPTEKPAAPKELGPDESLNAVSAAVQKGDLMTVWKALPPSYQKDIDGLIDDFAAKVDPELWNKSFQLLGKLAKLVKEKKTFFLGSKLLDPLLAQAPPGTKDQLTQSWDGVATILEAVANSDIKTIDGLKKANCEQFIAGTLTSVAQHGLEMASKLPNPDVQAALEKAKGSKATLVEVKGDEAQVKMTAPGEEPKTQTVKRVEGKWLPAEMVDSWKEQMAVFKEGIAKMEIPAEQKTGALAMMGGVESAVDQLLAAKTQEEFDTALQGIAILAGSMLGGGAAPPM